MIKFAASVRAISFSSIYPFLEVLNQVRPGQILDIGGAHNQSATDLSLKRVLPPGWNYTVADIRSANISRVDVVLEDPYAFPFADESFDVVVSIDTFEHADFFWLTLLEMIRVCRADGLIFISAPQEQKYHAVPTDSWRFQNDAPHALERWAHRNGFPVVLRSGFTVFNTITFIYGRSWISPVLDMRTEQMNRLPQPAEIFEARRDCWGDWDDLQIKSIQNILREVVSDSGNELSSESGIELPAISHQTAEEFIIAQCCHTDLSDFIMNWCFDCEFTFHRCCVLGLLDLPAYKNKS